MLANLSITSIVKFTRNITVHTSNGPRTIRKGTLAMVHANDAAKTEVTVDCGDGRDFICAVADGDVEPV